MSPRDKRLEQAEPKANTPTKQWERKREPPSASGKKAGGFKSKDLPTGTIEQHRAKPGKTSPQ